MCLDLYYAEQVAKTGVPVLRFYSWQPYCLSLGHHQRLTDVNVQRVKDCSYNIVRRPTGGSAGLDANAPSGGYIAGCDCNRGRCGVNNGVDRHGDGVVSIGAVGIEVASGV